jgi:hypothetical protein
MKPPTKGDEIWRKWFAMTENAQQPEIAPRHARTDSRLPMGMVALASLAIIVAVVGSRYIPASGSAGAQPSGPATVAATVSGTAAPADLSGFYLRAWRTQALAPQYTFAWLPVTTISNGQFIDGQVAVADIYPGPAYVGPYTSSLSSTALATILAEARKDGLLDLTKDFAGNLPGGALCHLEIKYDGKTSELTGACPTDAAKDAPAPGSADAYASFWNRLTDLRTWLGAEVGASTAYEPTAMDVMLLAPTEPQAGITPTEQPWPLTSKLDAFGATYGGGRCGTVSGADLATLLPVVRSANQLTRFVDSTGVKRTLVARPLVPGEASVCA